MEFIADLVSFHSALADEGQSSSNDFYSLFTFFCSFLLGLKRIEWVGAAFLCGSRRSKQPWFSCFPL